MTAYLESPAGATSLTGRRRRRSGFWLTATSGRLHDAESTFTLVFEILDEGGNGLFLVFGTGDLLGLEKMKDAMWSVAPHLAHPPTRIGEAPGHGPMLPGAGSDEQVGGAARRREAPGPSRR